METATRMTGEAQEQGKQVLGSATEKGQQVAQVARAEAGAVKEEVARQSGKLVQEVVDQVRIQMEAQAGQLVAGFRRLVEQGDALVGGNPEQAGPVADVARQVVSELRSLSETVESKGLDGTVREVQRFARRRPAAFLLGATVVGFGLGRLARAATSGAAAASFGAPGESFGGDAYSGDPSPLAPGLRGPVDPADRRASDYRTGPVVPVMPPMVMGTDTSREVL